MNNDPTPPAHPQDEPIHGAGNPAASILRKLVSHFAALEPNGDYWGHDTNLGDQKEAFKEAEAALLAYVDQHEAELANLRMVCNAIAPAKWTDPVTGKSLVNGAYVDRQRADELTKVWSGMNDAAQVRDGGYSSRNLNLDDLSFYLHNRRRELDGKKPHTPDEWFEAER